MVVSRSAAARVHPRRFAMLVSTLPELPGRTFEVRGFVFAQAVLGAIGGGNTHKMVTSLVEQAATFGADGVIDVRTVIGGDNAHCVMTGTAVRLLPATNAR
jgi:uncharacterized protein YbjQ (UPF0145 family)